MDLPKPPKITNKELTFLAFLSEVLVFSSDRKHVSNCIDIISVSQKTKSDGFKRAIKLLRELNKKTRKDIYTQAKSSKHGRVGEAIVWALVIKQRPCAVNFRSKL